MKARKHRVKRDQLRDLLNRKAEALGDEAIKTEGQVSDGQLESLGRLARLVEIRATSQPQPPRARWPIAILLAVTLIVVSVLLFARVSETEIELDLSLSDVGFKLPRQQVLTDVMRLSTLGVSGLEEIQFPRAGTRDAQTFRASEGTGSWIRLSTGSDAPHQGTVTLAALPLPSGTQIWLRPTEVPKEYRLTINGADLKLKADVSGSVGIALAGTRPEQLTFLSPESIHLRSGPNDVDLDLGFSTLSKNIFSPQLSATDISLLRVDKLLDDQQTVVRRVSTVLSGTLYFESLGGQELRLRPGEALRFESSQGEIRKLELHDDHIAFAFHGNVRGMTTGPEVSRSLMPTYLEWLRARHGLSLLWGTTLYVLGLIVSVLSWWRAPR